MGTWRRGVVVGGRKRQLLKNKKGRQGNRRLLERKLRQLHKIIPGGGSADQVMDIEALFQRVALHIRLLESRVKLLNTVYALFSASH